MVDEVSSAYVHTLYNRGQQTEMCPRFYIPEITEMSGVKPKCHAILGGKDSEAAHAHSSSSYHVFLAHSTNAFENYK